MRAQGKIGLITGAASGLGYETAKLLASEGAKVLLADIDIEGGEKAAAEIRAAGGDAIFQKVDVSIEQEIIRKLIEEELRYSAIEEALCDQLIEEENLNLKEKILTATYEKSRKLLSSIKNL